MNIEDMFNFIERLEVGKFCTVRFPIATNLDVTVTAMYMGKDRKEIYSFFDNGSIAGTFKVSRKFIEQGKITFFDKYDMKKAMEVQQAMQIKSEREQARHNKRGKHAR